MSLLPITNDTLRRWVSVRPPFLIPDLHRLVVTVDGEEKTYIGIYGSGPFSCDDLQLFLESLDFYVVDMAGINGFRGLTLILGEYDGYAKVLAGGSRGMGCEERGGRQGEVKSSTRQGVF